MSHPSMSHRYDSRSVRRPSEERAHRHAAASTRAGVQRRDDYTLGLAGHQIRFGPIAFWTLIGTLVIMAAWSVVTATYFAFRDDVLTRLIVRQTDIQYAYEDRISDLRSQVDQLASRQLLNQEQYEQKLEQLVRRQALLESRAAALSTLPDQSVTGSIKPSARISGGERVPLLVKPSPISDTVILLPPPERDARLESRPLPGQPHMASSAPSGGIEARLARIEQGLDRVETSQMTALDVLDERYDAQTRRMAEVLMDLGLDSGKIAPRTSAMGGPFVPLRGVGSAFDRQLHRVELARSQLDHLTRALVAVPVRKPVVGEIDTTSGFGMRIDPFLHTPAMHTGLDFRGDTGEPIRATAAGTVVFAGWSGGYGRMVEVDHGNGLSTRYGHLSSIDVEVGQTVRVDQVVGRLGSSGRSTGPHLHYETRIDGEAVDPQRFLRAGLRLESRTE